MKKIFSIFGLLFIVLFFITGCGPSYVTVRTRPEPPLYARPVAPGGNYVWIDGEWIRSGHGYAYRQGYSAGHVQDIISTSPAIGRREDVDGFGFRGIGISA